jgi:hypothetical protein
MVEIAELEATIRDVLSLQANFSLAPHMILCRLLISSLQDT